MPLKIVTPGAEKLQATGPGPPTVGCHKTAPCYRAGSSRPPQRLRMGRGGGNINDLSGGGEQMEDLTRDKEEMCSAFLCSEFHEVQ